ncbi:hypothetical protein PVAND_005503 [Polypedilum vanderplanki]|uniref:glutathione transferase n=1 Tax=Polypedilum vanderplanki TaxID=319348 RepID=A0A9J6C0D6_POLVA|nr:hypothetical protein PVAND_005503 [Polypedilum vanderplanki]
MVLKLYFLSASPPARAVLLTCRNLKLDVELITIDLFKSEHYKPDFLKLNPAHQIPVLVDNDFVLSESRAIMGYLVNKYQPDSSLYPTDVYKRALIDQRLYFDAQVFERNAAAIRPAFREPPEKPTNEAKYFITDYMEILDKILSDSVWFAGNSITIADYTILVNISQIKACGFDISKYTNLVRWFEKCKSIEGFDENNEAALKLGELFKSRVGNVF